MWRGMSCCGRCVPLYGNGTSRQKPSWIESRVYMGYFEVLIDYSIVWYNVACHAVEVYATVWKWYVKAEAILARANILYSHLFSGKYPLFYFPAHKFGLSISSTAPTCSSWLIF